MSLKEDKMPLKGSKSSHNGFKGAKVCFKEAKSRQMDSVRLQINEHMTSVGEEIFFVLEKRTSADVCWLRVFVLERLSAAAEVMCSLFLKEMETLRTAAEGRLCVSLTCTPGVGNWRPGGHMRPPPSLIALRLISQH